MRGRVHAVRTRRRRRRRAPRCSVLLLRSTWHTSAGSAASAAKASSTRAGSASHSIALSLTGPPSASSLEGARPYPKPDGRGMCPNSFRSSTRASWAAARRLRIWRSPGMPSLKPCRSASAISCALSATAPSRSRAASRGCSTSESAEEGERRPAEEGRAEGGERGDRRPDEARRSHDRPPPVFRVEAGGRKSTSWKGERRGERWPATRSIQ